MDQLHSLSLNVRERFEKVDAWQISSLIVFDSNQVGG
jgi:hypothetical protein